ncbi:MAG: DUF4349 domain-containing protein [Pseudomonadota bacterium]
MRKSWMLIGCGPFALAACSGAESEMAESADMMAMEAPEMAVDVAEEAAEDAVADGAGAVPDALSADDTSIGQPQIAYRYALGFRLPSEAIKPLQERHADMCEAKGPRVCRIISMDQTDSDGDYGYGNLRLAVAAGEARAFSKDLETSSGESDGELTSSSITGEDLSKQIVDTEAKLRARTLLRDRLMDILRTRQGTVAELVEAERGVAQVNQEIDQAQSWLTEMRGRVAFSQMEISYNSGSRSSGSFTDPIRDAWNSLGGILGYTIAFLMMAATVLIPIGLLVWLAMRLLKWARRESEEGLAREVTNDAAESEA